MSLTILAATAAAPAADSRELQIFTDRQSARHLPRRQTSKEALRTSRATSRVFFPAVFSSPPIQLLLRHRRSHQSVPCPPLIIERRREKTLASHPIILFILHAGRSGGTIRKKVSHAKTSAHYGVSVYR